MSELDKTIEELEAEVSAARLEETSHRTPLRRVPLKVNQWIKWRVKFKTLDGAGEETPEKSNLDLQKQVTR